ncbi:MAG TPA: hypothetical protein ENK98_09890 [Epsilonproteobacteria bacterium]|nr:hypothetical protein [Campylobacterota bacterium]
MQNIMLSHCYHFDTKADYYFTFQNQEKNMESIFVVKKFEEGWDTEELIHDTFIQEEYCIHALEIPDDKIYGTEMIGNGLLEIVLTDISKNELNDDWYINLSRVSA